MSQVNATQMLDDPGASPALAAMHCAHELTLLASTARTATVSSADQTTRNAKGLLVVVDVTAIAATPSVTPKISMKDVLSGKYIDLLVAAAALTGTGTAAYLLGTGLGAAANGITQVQGFPVPRIWRVTMTHADADSITYSVAAHVLV